jgi:hypothetical protein
MGKSRQSVRAELIDEMIGKDRIRSDNDHIGLCQAFKQRHINAVLDRQARLEQGERLRTPIVSWS